MFVLKRHAAFVLFFSGHVAGVSSILMTMTMASCRLSFLVGAFKHFFNFRQGVARIYIYIYGIILPIDELHHFSRWLLHHQPALNQSPVKAS